MHNAQTQTGEQLFTDEELKLQEIHTQTGFKHFKSLAYLYWGLFRVLWGKIVATLLTLHAIYFMYEALKFLFLEYPELENIFALGQASTEEIRIITAEAITVTLTVFIDTLFAIRLSRRDGDLTHMLDLIVATLILLFHQSIMNFLLSFDLTMVWSGIWTAVETYIDTL